MPGMPGILIGGGAAILGGGWVIGGGCGRATGKVLGPGGGCTTTFGGGSRFKP